MPGANGQKGPIPRDIAISLAGGLETKVDPNQVSAPKCLIADNVRMTTTGAVRKRYGLTPLPAPQTGSRIDVGATNKELVSTQNNTFYAFDPDNSNWRNIGELYTMGLASKTITTLTLPPDFAQNASTAPSWAYLGSTGVMTYAYQVNSVIWVNLTCFDINTGAVYWTRVFNDLGYITSSPSVRNIVTGSTSAVTPGTTTALLGPKVIAYQGTFVFACLQSDNSYLRLRAFSFLPTQKLAASPNFYAKTNCTVLDGANATFPTQICNGPMAYDMTSNSTDFCMAAVGLPSSGGSSFYGTVVRSNQTLPLTSTLLTKNMTGQQTGNPQVKTSMAENVFVCLITEPKQVSYCATTTGPVSGWGASTALNGYSQTLTAAPSTAPTSSVGLSGPYSAAIQDTGTGTNWTFTVSDAFTICNGLGDNTSSGSPTMTTYSNVAPKMNAIRLTDYESAGDSSVASEIFYLNGIPHMWMVNGPGSDTFITYLLVNLADQNVVAHTYYLRARVFNGGDNHAPQVYTINGVPTTILIETFNQSFNADLVGLTQQQPQYLRTPFGALLTGADTKYYDGQLLRTAGWLKVPEVGNRTAALVPSTGGSMTPSTTYTYFFVLVDYDASGNAIISSPSPPYTTTLSSAQNAVVLDLTSLLPPIVFSATGPIVEIYRNTATDQLNYHLNTTLSVANGNYASWTDYLSDGNISGQRLLYSPPSGGEIPNDPAPPSTCGVSTKTKAFLASAEHGSWLYYSKPFFAGRAPEFNAGSFIDVEPATGDIVGLAALDEVVIIFKRKNIYLLSGTGPDATGSGSFSPITNISTDRGLVDANSIVTTNDGVYFRTQRGIEIIDRGYSISYIGAPVEGIVKGNTVLSAVSAPEQSQVRFALASGQSVVYDYSTAAWTTYTYAVNTQPAPLQVTSQVNSRGLNYIATNTPINGVIYYEDQTKFIDDAALYPVNVQSAYTTMGGPQGWGRVRRANILGTCQSLGTSITVTFMYDYAQDTEATATYTLTKVGAFNLRVRAPRQVCQAVGIKVTVTGNSEGIVLSDIVLETSAKSGNLRLPDTQSI